VHSLYDPTSFLMRAIAPIKQNLFIIQIFKTQYLINRKFDLQSLLKKNVPTEIRSMKSMFCQSFKKYKKTDTVALCEHSCYFIKCVVINTIVYRNNI
jgi:hypothetical protein